MTLSMGQAEQLGQLAGHLRVGPHYYPRRRSGVQIIQRGPHGARLAADPVRTRAGRPRGSGFRLWVEELNYPAGQEWSPQQSVIGLMGMGEIPAGWLCPYTRAQLGREIAKVEAAVLNASDPASLESVRAQNERLRECHMQLGQHDYYPGHLARIQVVSQNVVNKKRSGALFQAGIIDASGYMRIPTTEEYCQANPAACFPEDPCSTWDIPCHAGQWFKRNWWKAALATGALIVLYNASAGLGRRIGGGR